MLTRSVGRLTLLTVAVAATLLLAAAPPQGERQVAALIQRLADDDFDERQKAEQELIRIGKPASGQLIRAAVRSEDLEVRRRARQVLQAVEPFVLERMARTQEIAQVSGIDATTWGESVANPFATLSEQSKKKLRAAGVEADRLPRMRARLIRVNTHDLIKRTFVNTDPDVILIFDKGSISRGAVHSVGPVLVVDDAEFEGEIRGAGLVWLVGESGSLRRQASGLPVLTLDYGWKVPGDLSKPLLAATKEDPAATEELATERKSLAAFVRKKKGTDVTGRARRIANPFTDLTDEGKKKLMARGVDVTRLVRLKKALYLTGTHLDRSDALVNTDPDAVLVLGEGFKTFGPIYSQGPVLVLESASTGPSLTGADLVWFVERSYANRTITGAPVVLQPSAKYALLAEGGKHLWHGDYGWRRPKGWPGIE